jgi:hypothetical protein
MSLEKIGEIFTTNNLGGNMGIIIDSAKHLWKDHKKLSIAIIAILVVLIII